MALIKGIHHVALKCADNAEFSKTVGFYKDVLGLPVCRSWGEGKDAGIMFACDGVLVEIFASGKENTCNGSVNHFAFAVDDVPACIEAVRAAGYEVTMEPTDIVINSEPALPARIGFCVGPCGESIEFFCER